MVSSEIHENLHSNVCAALDIDEHHQEQAWL